MFALEKHLEDFLVRNWAQTELGRDYDVFEDDGERIKINRADVAFGFFGHFRVMIRQGGGKRTRRRRTAFAGADLTA